jgi:hypothetical protein
MGMLDFIEGYTDGIPEIPVIPAPFRDVLVIELTERG